MLLDDEKVPQFVPTRGDLIELARCSAEEMRCWSKGVEAGRVTVSAERLGEVQRRLDRIGAVLGEDLVDAELNPGPRGRVLQFPR
jgi:hypothetical protein